MKRVRGQLLTSGMKEEVKIDITIHGIGVKLPRLPMSSSIMGIYETRL
jgi:hypothetical protein